MAQPIGTRVRVGLVGQATGFSLIRVDLTADEIEIRTDLYSKAAVKLDMSHCLPIWRGCDVAGAHCARAHEDA